MAEGAAVTTFSLKYRIVFNRILSKIKNNLIGNCTGHPFLNFLDPPLLMCAITCNGKSTTPLNSLASWVLSLKRNTTEKNVAVTMEIGEGRLSSHFVSWMCHPCSPRYLFKGGYKKTPLRLFVELKFILRPIWDEIHTKLQIRIIIPSSLVRLVRFDILSL